MTWTNFARGLRAFTLLTLAACGADRTTSPVHTSQLPNTTLLSDLTALKPLQRTVRLEKDITVRQVIGPAGGTISIPRAGFTLDIPAGAVTLPVTFSVTALEGNAVAYEFAPHGITFNKPLAARQDLSVTRNVPVLAPLLKAGYFPDRSLIRQDGLLVLVSELFAGQLDLGFSAFRWRIPHFSGYIVAW